MQYEVEINGRAASVSVSRRDGRFLIALGDKQWTVDAAAVGTHGLSMLIERASGVDGASTGFVESREVSLATDAVTGQLVVGLGAVPMRVGLDSRRRWGRKDDGHATGPQRLVAPMPGKIVRVLAAPGTVVAHRQPIIVIEAMKMENELRASRDGVVTDVFVREGQSVEAGTALAVITPP
jgi:biotin carboxyl carrier protein